MISGLGDSLLYGPSPSLQPSQRDLAILAIRVKAFEEWKSMPKERKDSNPKPRDPFIKV